MRPAAAYLGDRVPPMSTLSRRNSPCPSPWLVALWVAALLGLQALGLTHRVAHAPLKPPAAEVLADEGTAGHYGHAALDADCLLFDQLALGAAGVGAQAVPVGLPVAELRCATTTVPAVVAVWRSQSARAPPEPG